MTILTKEQDERGPIKQLAASRKSVQDTLSKSRNELTGIVQRHTAVEQDRTNQITDIRTRFDESYLELNKQVSLGLQDLESAWSDLQKCDLPLDLQRQLNAQIQSTESIIAHKLTFIKELEQEVLTRDHEYVNKNADHNHTIDNFVHQMRQQENDLRELIASELSKVHSSYEQERSTTIIQITKEVKQLAAKRQEREQSLMKQTIQNANDQRDRLEELRQSFAQEYLSIRCKFETRLEAAQKEYEDRLAQFNFSKEQLEYDYRILQENEEEHQEKVKMQQKKMVRQRDCLRGLRKQYKEDDARFKRQNFEITKEYTRIAESYRELQLRFRNVAYTDFNAFREVWNLNERRLHDMVLRLLEADRVVMGQQLGKDARPPDPVFLKRWVVGTDDFEDLTKTPQAPAPAAHDAAARHAGSGLLSAGVLSDALEHLRRMITNEVGFLVDERVRGIIGGDAGDDAAATIRLDVLLQELGITEAEDVEQLLSHFIRDTEFGELEAAGFVRPHEVVEGLRHFVEAFHPNRKQNQMTLFSQITADATQNTSSEVARAILQLQARMRKQMAPQRRFYERKAEVVTEEMWRIWNATFRGLQRYLKELEERAKLVLETDRLKGQNGELEMLLSRYLESEANNQLIYAPGQTVDFQSFE